SCEQEYTNVSTPPTAPSPTTTGNTRMLSARGRTRALVLLTVTLLLGMAWQLMLTRDARHATMQALELSQTLATTGSRLLFATAQLGTPAADADQAWQQHLDELKRQIRLQLAQTHEPSADQTNLLKRLESRIARTQQLQRELTASPASAIGQSLHARLLQEVLGMTEILSQLQGELTRAAPGPLDGIGTLSLILLV